MLPAPQRLVDTRQAGGAVAAGTSRCFGIAGLGGVPVDAAAVIVNVTAVGYAGIGWLTLYANGQAVPATSTLNFDPHEYAIANGAIIRVGTSGQVCVNAGNNAADIILDATGFVSSAGLVQVATLASPQRLVDARLAAGPIAAGSTSCFAVAGQGGIPANATAVILNVTAVGYSTIGWLRLYPNGLAVPGTSTLNFDPSEYAIADGAIIKPGTGGQVCVSAGYGASNVSPDATGYPAH